MSSEKIMIPEIFVFLKKTLAYNYHLNKSERDFKILDLTYAKFRNQRKGRLLL